MPNCQKGSITTFLLLGLLVFVLGFGLVYVRFNKVISLNLVSQSKEGSPVLAASNIPTFIPTPTPILWKTYTNTEHKFQFAYPAEGMLWEEDGYILGSCGENIKEKDDSRGHHIFFDNLLDIRVVKWSSNLEEYLRSIGAFTQYDLEKIEGSGADEAVRVIGLKKGSEYAVGYPPLIYVSHIYKKADRLFLLLPFQNPIVNPAGCTNPAILDPVSHSHLKVKEWDISKSFKFN